MLWGVHSPFTRFRPRCTAWTPAFAGCSGGVGWVEDDEPGLFDRMRLGTLLGPEGTPCWCCSLGWPLPAFVPNAALVVVVVRGGWGVVVC